MRSEGEETQDSTEGEKEETLGIKRKGSRKRWEKVDRSVMEFSKEGSNKRVKTIILSIFPGLKAKSQPHTETGHRAPAGPVQGAGRDHGTVSVSELMCEDNVRG